MSYVIYALEIAILGLIAFAFLDATIRPAQAFTWAETMKKPLWMLVLAAAFIIRAGLFNLSFGRFISFILLITAVYYLGPVRDKLKTFPKNPKKGNGGW